MRGCGTTSLDRRCVRLNQNYSFVSSLVRTAVALLILSFSVLASNDYLAGSAGNGLKDVVDGEGSVASFSGPSGIVMVSATQALITDWSGHAVRSIDFSNASAMNVTTIAGTSVAGYQDGASHLSTFNNPSAISVSLDGSTAYISDFNNLAVRVLDLTALTVRTLVNNSILASSVRLRGPRGLAVHPSDNSLYINDITVIYKLNLQTLAMVRFAGRVTDGAFLDGLGTNAYFAGLMAMAMEPDGSRLLVTDVLVQVALRCSPRLCRRQGPMQAMQLASPTTP
jgi:DNA-binding beta-propeller fold protein YncE